MSHCLVSRRLPKPHPPLATVAMLHAISSSDAFADGARFPDDEPDEPWDDSEPDDDVEPLEDSDLEIEEEPDPDEGDFWFDPDESEDPWN